MFVMPVGLRNQPKCKFKKSITLVIPSKSSAEQATKHLQVAQSLESVGRPKRYESVIPTLKKRSCFALFFRQTLHG